MWQVNHLDEFFATAPPLADAVERRATLDAFVSRHVAANRPLACVTSGGTSVPLERRTIRRVDNFSGGARGAASTEYFLEEGYAVIFLARAHSAQPFVRSAPDVEQLLAAVQPASAAASAGAPPPPVQLQLSPEVRFFSYLWPVTSPCSSCFLG